MPLGAVRVDEEGYSTLTGPWGGSAATTTLPEIRKVALLSDGTPVVAAGTSLHWLGDLQLTVPNAYVPASDPDNDIVGLVVDSQDRVTLATLYDDYDTIALHRFAGGVGGPVVRRRRRGPRVGDRPSRRRSPWTRGPPVLAGSTAPTARSTSLASSEAGALDPTFGDGGSAATTVVEPYEDEEGTIDYGGALRTGPVGGWDGRPAGRLRPRH